MDLKTTSCPEIATETFSERFFLDKVVFRNHRITKTNGSQMASSRHGIACHADIAKRRVNKTIAGKRRTLLLDIASFESKTSADNGWNTSSEVSNSHHLK